MQLEERDAAAATAPAPGGEVTPSLRDRLGKAALALLLVPAAASAESTQPANQLDITTLLYGEQGRAQVYEPIVRASRLFGNGQSLSGQLTVDVITGASPTGALPSGSVQTHTSASGRVTTSAAGEIPLNDFQDQRVALDGEWQAPLGRLAASTIGLHASHEKDYESLGANGKVTFDLMQKLFTLTVGAGVNEDRVSPLGGTPEGLTDGNVLVDRNNSKRSTSVLFGLSRILSRRWMVALDASRTAERGYLTEPYKVISLMDPRTGVPVGQLTDKRPSTRDRNSLLLSSVYHLTDDIFYSTYRYYWDSWDVRSHTLELKYRHDLGDGWYLEPRLRLYQQTAANFFTAGLVQGADLPEFATADYRLGKLSSVTLGAAFTFRAFESPGEWTVRADYIRQQGDGSPDGAIGVQRRFDLAPGVNSVALVVAYSRRF